MATVYKFQAVLSGWIGGPGVNTWHMCTIEESGGESEAALSNAADDILSVYNALKTYLHSSVKVEISPIVEGFDIASGSLLEVKGIDPGVPVQGSSSTGTLSRATQVCARLQTDRIRGNRLMQGRHFIGPVGATPIGSDGQVSAAARNAIQAAYGGVLDANPAGLRLVVWGRPQPKSPKPYLQTGEIGYVQGVLANATPGTLQSRKT